MLDRERLLNEIISSENITYIERDKDGLVVSTNNEGIIPIYDEIKNSDIVDKNKYYHKKSNTWYKIGSVKIGNTEIEYLIDVTDTQKELYYLKRDDLTGLMKDRNEASMLMEEYIEQAIENGEEFSLLAADIDDFKSINDTYGHYCGDFVLKFVSEILISSTNHSDDIFDNKNDDIILRFGGDEFLILLKNRNISETEEKISEIKRKLQENYIVYKDKKISVSMSIGYSSLNDTTEKYNSEAARKYLYSNADIDLYRRKKEK